MSAKRYFHIDGKTCKICNLKHNEPLCPARRLDKVEYIVSKVITYSDGSTEVEEFDERYVNIFDGEIYHEGTIEIMPNIIDKCRYRYVPPSTKVKRH